MFTAALVALLTGCTAVGPDADGAARVAEDFHRAVAAGHGDLACSMLSDSARSAVEKSAGSCSVGILNGGLPTALTALASEAYGQAAQVRMVGDVVFLGFVDGRWQVTAAGCRPQPPGPYDCTVEGG
ncbi:MAG TPA: hypothetical protein VIU11_18075 [Nakamurella sp.]